MKRAHTLACVLLLTAAAACSRASNPASPSEAAGVTINGSIVAPGGSGAGGGGSATWATTSAASTAPPGLTVSAAGTAISALVDVAGNFSLKNVPPGNVDLRFTAPAFSAALSLLDVRTGETISIAVSLDSSSATLESQRRSNGREVQLEGRVELLPPDTLPGEFVVAGQTVSTDASTRFFLRGQTAATFADLVVGQRVHVKGQTGATTLVASVVDIQNTNISGGLNVNGVISGFTGTPSAFEFMVNGQLVKGDATTEFFGNSQFLLLVDGVSVVVKGVQKTGYVYAARLHVEVEEIEFTGVISVVSGTAPDLMLMIDAYPVKTNDLTEVKRKGDRQDVSTLYAGQTVEVSGWLLPNGVVVARKINIVADAPGGIFVMEGSVGSLSGSCAAMTRSFSISGYLITTDASTTFTPNCGAITNGTKVLVKGIVQANLSVLAQEVTKK